MHTNGVQRHAVQVVHVYVAGDIVPSRSRVRQRAGCCCSCRGAQTQARRCQGQTEVSLQSVLFMLSMQAPLPLIRHHPLHVPHDTQPLLAVCDITEQRLKLVRVHICL